MTCFILIRVNKYISFWGKLIQLISKSGNIKSKNHAEKSDSNSFLDEMKYKMRESSWKVTSGSCVGLTTCQIWFESIIIHF